MPTTSPIALGGRRELLVDDYLVESLTGGAALRLHHPQPREVVITHDESWEGCTSGYHTIFRDGDLVRMYYRGSQADVRRPKEAAHPEYCCYAESADGLRWTKPSLGLVEHDGSRANNIVSAAPGTHNLVPFRDTNPGARPEARYKAVGSYKDELYAFHSADGLHWQQTWPQPIISVGRFDSQNVAYWDALRGEYRCYYRDYIERTRAIVTATSADFHNWSEGQPLVYPGQPQQHLYTNAIRPYDRAPHLFVGFPTRFLGERGSTTEGLFMSSRDGVTFNQWGEAWIRPGLNRERWGNRSNYIWHGLLETASDLPGAPAELSLYSIEGYYEGTSDAVRRYTLRTDGFVSLNAPFAGGELLTKPLTFAGEWLSLNVSTAAAGSLKVALLAADGGALEGFGLDDCDEFYGDTLDHAVTWHGSADVSRLAGQPIRLRFVLHDADLYSLQFQGGE